MGALESKRWTEIPAETPQKSILPEEGMIDPRSPTFQYNRTPILLQEYDESPQNINSKAEFRDPRSPSVKITRTPLNISKTSSENEDVFESHNVEGITNPAFSSKSTKVDPENSGVLTLRKEKASLKKTTSPGDFKRRNRLSRRQSFPQKLFSDKGSTLPRSPLAQRNHSMPDDDAMVSGKNKKFTFVPRKKGFIAEDFGVDKENSVEQVLL